MANYRKLPSRLQTFSNFQVGLAWLGLANNIYSRGDKKTTQPSPNRLILVFKLRLVPLWIVATMAPDPVILPALLFESWTWDNQQIKLNYNNRDKGRTETEVGMV